ncbi:MAG TPA: hypothetical protein VFU90_14795 [Candidatus Tumulicola sp.]|nr:hypothetical protein [Candidatus Tumulicola sp.]
MTAKRTASQPIISLRRSSRSASDPPISENNEKGATSQMNETPVESAEWVMWYASSGTASVRSPSPSRLSDCPTKYCRNGRDAKMLGAFATSTIDRVG